MHFFFQCIDLYLLTGKGMKWYKWYKIFWNRIFPPAASSPHPPDARPCHSAPAPPPSHSLLQWILGMTLSFNMHKYEIPGFMFFRLSEGNACLRFEIASSSVITNPQHNI